MRKALFSIALLCAIIPFLTSCGSGKNVVNVERQQLFKDKAGKLEPTLFISNTDATQRLNVVMSDASGKFVTFSENPPDAAVESALSIFAKATVDGKEAGNIDAETKIEFAKTIAQLGKRTEAVSFQRDGMFRLSELFINDGIDKSDLVMLITELQKNATEIAKVNAAKEVTETKLKQLQELNGILAKADPASPKLTTAEIQQLVNDLNN